MNVFNGYIGCYLPLEINTYLRHYLSLVFGTTYITLMR